MGRTSYVWNSVPGAVSILPEYSQLLTDYPFYWRSLGYTVDDSFTAVIYATNRTVLPSSSIYRLIRALSGSAYLKKVCQISERRRSGASLFCVSSYSELFICLVSFEEAEWKFCEMVAAAASEIVIKSDCKVVLCVTLRMIVKDVCCERL